PFSEEIFTRLGDTYRRIRNTLRILHGNLFDYESGSHEGRKQEFTLVDRWILDRLDHVIADCRSAYEAFEVHKVYHTLNQFCAVDLSSLYIDITKDRMYCDAPDSPRRRATQTAMHKIFDALCRLLAPILVFTAEEAWGYSGAGGSVHLELFPEQTRAERDSDSASRMAEALQLRNVISREIEQARQGKIVGNSLEAKVCLELRKDESSWDWFKDLGSLEEIFILSDLRLVDGAEVKAVVTRTEFRKCARCWRHRPAVGLSKAHPDVCDRCEAVVAAAANKVRST
ncbi:MAG: class I tRNA ligase family protein, partial [Verrucomicrobiota bacterium]|nr:class I tRNA ligase family protein [Verrucomicrobiota bacterium]